MLIPGCGPFAFCGRLPLIESGLIETWLVMSVQYGSTVLTQQAAADGAAMSYSGPCAVSSRILACACLCDKGCLPL